MREKLEKLIQYGMDITDLYLGYHIPAYASQAAYFVMLSALPLIMLAIITIGAVFPFDMVQVNGIIQEFVTEGLQEFALRLFDEIFNRSNIPLASITTIFLIWSATKGVRSIGSGVQTIYDSSQEYNIVKATLHSILYTIIMIFVLVVSFVVLVFASPLERLVQSVLGNQGGIILAVLNLRNILFFVTLTFLFMLAYTSLAKSDISFWAQLPGAAIAAGGWIIFSFGYSIYIKYFSNYAYLYGSLGAAMLFMLWIYMCMNILLAGALFNKLRLNNYKIL